MSRLRRILVLVSVAATAMTLGGAGWSGASPVGGEEPQAQPEETHCPEDRWSLPVQIEGLVCILLLPKPEEPPAAPPAR